MTESDQEPKNPTSSEPTQPPPAKPKSDAAKARYVWQSLWFQWVLGTIVFFLFLSFVIPPIFWLVNKLSPVLTPVLLGLVLAYIFSPLTCWAEARYGIKRQVTAGLILAGVVVVLAIAIPIVVVSVVQQANLFISKSPAYTETVLSWFDLNPDQARGRIDAFIASIDLTQVDTGAAQKALGLGAGALFTGFSIVSYAAIFVLVTAFCFFIFSWRLDGLKRWFTDFIPKPYRGETLRILGLMDQTVSAIIRGRLTQSLVIMVVLSVGWYVAEVPYWLLLGVLGGALNLLPFAAILSWPLAVILLVVDVASTGGTGIAIVMAVVWPTVVYVVAQSLDGWVVEPLVQGKATGMDALTVLLVVLAGGAVLGLLGIVIAVPLAACIKILSQELLLPKARAFAENPPDFQRKGQT